MLCEFEAKPMPISKKTVGIDLGLTDLFITSDSKKSGNPRHTKCYEAKLAYREGVLKQEGSWSDLRTLAHTMGGDCQIAAKTLQNLV